MRYIIYALCIGFINSLKAFDKKPETLQKLCTVNAEWQHQPDAMQYINGSFPNNKTFNDWIKTHLLLVEKTLRARNISSYSETQLKNRLRLLDELHAYALAGIFPVNDYLPYQNPVFIDRKGTHCAVGYLMQQSGHDDLAQRIDKAEKFAYVKNIKTSGVNEWAIEHGFSQNELAWIQPGYPPSFDAKDMDAGLNGPVYAMTVDPVNQTLFAAGNFSQTTSGIQASNIAMWNSGFAGWDWMPVGSGTNGTVHCLLVHNNKLYVGGEFSEAGGTAASHIAMFDIASGQWQSMGSLDSTVRALVVYKNEIYAGGLFSGFVSKWNGSTWTDITQGFLYGEGVRALEVWNNQLVIGGNFELATGALRRHVALYDSAITLMAMGTPTPVNDFENHNGKLYAACDAVNGADTCALAVFDEVSSMGWETLISSSSGLMDGFWGNAIYKLLSHNSTLYCAGDFNCSSGLTYGNHLMGYDRVLSGGSYYNQYSPLLTTDGLLRTLAVGVNELYFGGDFTANAFSDTLNHTGYLELSPAAVQGDGSYRLSFSFYPNPVSDVLHINCNEAKTGFSYDITDLSGRKLFEGNTSNASASVFTSGLTKGVYMLRINYKGRSAAKKFVKE